MGGGCVRAAPVKLSLKAFAVLFFGKVCSHFTNMLYIMQKMYRDIEISLYYNVHPFCLLNTGKWIFCSYRRVYFLKSYDIFLNYLKVPKNDIILMGHWKKSDYFKQNDINIFQVMFWYLSTVSSRTRQILRRETIVVSKSL